MIDFKDFIIEQEQITSTQKSRVDITAFFIDNDWFGIRPQLLDGKVFISEDDIKHIKEPLDKFLRSSVTIDTQELIRMFKERFPETAGKFVTFTKEASVPDEEVGYITDFLLFYLKKDLFFYDDMEYRALIKLAGDHMNKMDGDYLTFFGSWLRTKFKTRYHEDLIMKKRIVFETSNGAYDMDEYLELHYYLLNPEYIEDNEMYQKAAESKDYADTWLFLSMHLIASIRDTDLVRIYHPELDYTPEETLKKIRNNEFTFADSLKALRSVVFRLEMIPLTPNKNINRQNIPNIKLHFPVNAEQHFGTLFAICEAHHRLAGLDAKEPFIRIIKTYDQIKKYMGDEIGNLFLEADFRSRSANKSFMQASMMLSDNILGSEGPRINGMIIASMARSHKGSLNQFCETTEKYLKDANFSGLTPEFVAQELFERGVLSFVPSMLLQMVTDGKYKKLSVSEQTKMVKELNLTPYETERTVEIYNYNMNKAAEMVNMVAKSGAQEQDILFSIHLIGNGDAFSKNMEMECLLTALKRMCPFPNRQVCAGCKYAIGTFSTIWYLMDEYNRLNALLLQTENEAEKGKYMSFIKDIILPTLDDLMICMRERYGQEVYDAYRNIIKEKMSNVGNSSC